MAKTSTKKQAGARKTAKKKTTGTRKTSQRRTAGTAARKKTARKSRRTTVAAKRQSTRTSRAKTAARSAATRRRRDAPRPEKKSALSTAATAVKGTIASAVATVAGVFRTSESEADAIELLEQEHRYFEKLLKQGEGTSENAKVIRRELLETLAAALNAHELMEETVLYPALQSHPDAREVVLEGFQEHHVADLIVEELRTVATDDEMWSAKFKVLKENIEHHIQEEEGEMFRVARGIFSRDELRELARRMVEVRPKESGARRRR